MVADAKSELDRRKSQPVVAVVTESAPPPLQFRRAVSRQHKRSGREDVAGPFDNRSPRNLDEMPKLQRLSYKEPLEELAEKFHMSEDLLRKLNPGTHFDRAGENIAVAEVEPMQLRQGHRQHCGSGSAEKAERRWRDKARVQFLDRPGRREAAFGP